MPETVMRACANTHTHTQNCELIHTFYWGKPLGLSWPGRWSGILEANSKKRAKTRGTQILQKSRTILEIVGALRPTWSKSYTKDTCIWCHHTTFICPGNLGYAYPCVKDMCCKDGKWTEMVQDWSHSVVWYYIWMVTSKLNVSYDDVFCSLKVARQAV